MEAKTEKQHLLRVVLYGPESTGKTMLSQQLAEHFGCLWVPEFARGYLETKRAYYDPYGRKADEICQPQDIPPIVIGQIASEDAFLEQTKNLLVCDTNPLMTYVYNKYYFHQDDQWITDVVTQRQYDLYLLTNIDIPWVADSLRDRPDQREELYALFKSELDKRKFPYTVVQGNYESRLKICIQAVDQALAAR